MRWKPRGTHLIGHGAHRPLRCFGLDQLLDERVWLKFHVTRLGHQLRVTGRHAVQLQLLEVSDDFNGHGPLR